MKPTLPIKIEALPDTATSPALWRQIAPVLQAIADSESRNADLYRDEKIAYSAIAFATWKASKRQWLGLWQYLLECKVLQIGEVADSKPKPNTPKKQRPTTPPKNAKPRKKSNDISNPLRERSEKKILSDKQKGIGMRIVPNEVLAQVLNDKWQDSGAIAVKLNDVLETPLTLVQVSKLLNNRLRTGEIVRLERDHRELSYYSLVQATEFENQWLTLEMAYQLAKSRGCTAAKNTFRKTSKYNYSAYGLEFRKSVPEPENTLLRWRDTES